jgi:16S rRNA (uracil1498-N3)-methyltransferase
VSETWIHADPLPSAGEGLVLDADEARHAAGSRRLGPGDVVTLFDGRGAIARATLEAGETRKRPVARAEAHVHRPRPCPALRLGSALPKGDRQSTLLSMATQLGVAAFAPLACARSVAKPGRHAEARWQRVALSACKQSHNAWLPTLQAALRPGDFAADVAREGACIVLHAGGAARPLLEVARRALDPAPAGVGLIVGPEGGLTEAEVAACEAAGAMRASLGPTILRTETAATAALAVVRSLLDAR